MKRQEKQKRRTMPSVYATKTLKRAKVQNVKIWLKAYQQKTLVRVPSGDETKFIYAEIGARKTLFYIVGASDGSDRKICDQQKALDAFEQLVNFEKRQTIIA